MIRKLLALAALALAPAAHASPPLPAETIDAIAKALPACTGSWMRDEKITRPVDLAPRLALLARPSTALVGDEGSDLYEIGKAMLFPVLGNPKWLLDGKGFLTCPARPKEAVALLEYLAGTAPDEMRGPTNGFDLLGLAYQVGAVGPADPVRARRYYLRGRIHSQLFGHDSWSDGTDTDLLANIQRAGMRPYLEALAQDARLGGNARVILAEEVLRRDPAAARSLLLRPEWDSLRNLLDWEANGRVAMLADGSDVAVWARAARNQLGYYRLIPRMIKAAELANGGTIPTVSTPPELARYRPSPNPDELKFLSPTAAALPARALIDRTGRVLYTEACRTAQRVIVQPLFNRLAVTRIYDPASVPALPVATLAGRPAFAWVLLPAVRINASGEDKVAISFATTTPESCVASDMIDPPPPVAPSAPRG